MQSFLADFFDRSGSRVRTVVLVHNSQNFAQKFGGLPPQLRGKQCELRTSIGVGSNESLASTSLNLGTWDGGVLGVLGHSVYIG